MLSTPVLHQVVSLARANEWRLALIGDPRQLQGVGRGGLLDELCRHGRVDQLERLHRFRHPWEGSRVTARCDAGDPRGVDAYESHGRIIAGTLDEHLARMADTWITTTTVDARRRWWRRPTTTSTPSTEPSKRPASTPDTSTQPTTTPIAGGEHVYIGDTVATRRNDRRLTTSGGEPVRNRDTWTVTRIGGDGTLTVFHEGGHGEVTLPGRLLPRPCPFGIRGDRARLSVGDRRRRDVPGLVVDHSTRPIRRRHPR